MPGALDLNPAAGVPVGLTQEDLLKMLQGMGQPSEDTQRSARTQGLMQAALGVLGNSYVPYGHGTGFGAALPGIAQGLSQGLTGYQEELDRQQAQLGKRYQYASLASELQKKIALQQANATGDPAAIRAAGSALNPEKPYEALLEADKPYSLAPGAQHFAGGKLVATAPPVTKLLTDAELAQKQLLERPQLDIARARLGLEQDRLALAKQTQEGSQMKVRKEFNALPEVQNYKTIIPIVQSAREAVKTDTPAADMNLVYAVTKVMDPGSVTRPSEYDVVVAAGSPAERMTGMINYVKGGARLSGQQRTELLNELESRAKGHEDLYNNALTNYTSGTPQIGSLPHLQAGRKAAGTVETPTSGAVGGLSPSEQAELTALRAKHGRP